MVHVISERLEARTPAKAVNTNLQGQLANDRDRGYSYEAFGEVTGVASSPHAW